MNILLTSVGRRDYLVSYFKNVLAPIGGKVHAMNSDPESPALWIADYYTQSPLIFTKEYETFLLNYCLQHNIRAILSFFDIELPVLSRLKESFNERGISIIVADTWVTEMANDKWETQKFLKEKGFNTIASFLDINEVIKEIAQGKSAYPLYLKPRWGMGSKGVYKAENENELAFYYKKAKQDIANSYLKYENEKDRQNVLIQETLVGKEYGLDIINDLDGNPVITVVKEKLAMRGGETDVAITVKNKLLESLGNKIAKLTKHPGIMDVDVFLKNEKAYILEFNPRFGGGYPFSHSAGVDLPQAIVHWLQDKNYDTSTFFKPLLGIKGAKGISIRLKDGN